MVLPAAIDPTSYTSINDLFDDSYSIFQQELYKNRPNLFDRYIFINVDSTCDGKVEGFWHIASIGADHFGSDTYPCCKDITSGYCLFLCDVDHSDNFLKDSNSVPCIFRASKIQWVKYIIELANGKNHLTQVWKVKNKRKGQSDLCLRYIEGHIDYVIIFTIVYNDKKNDIKYYRLKTAITYN